MKKVLAALATAGALAGCGGAGHATTAAAVVKPLPAPTCQTGASYMGCSAPVPALSLPSNAAASRVGVAAGRRFPDVSSWQGHPNWAAAKPFIRGAVAKASEFSEDPDFAFNVSSFKRLGIPWAAYDFVRSCSASTFIAALRSVGGPTSAPPVLDMEVPAARGCAPSLAAQVFSAFHRRPVIYTAPGTWPGGSTAGLSLWQAEYGPTLHPAWRPVVAWQCTDGLVGCVTSIPGLGRVDVSVDRGFLERLQTKPKPKPKPKPVAPCFGPHAEKHPTGACAALETRVAGWGRARVATAKALEGADRGLSANRCRKPYRRAVCRDYGRLASVLRQRERFFASNVSVAIKANS